MKVDCVLCKSYIVLKIDLTLQGGLFLISDIVGNLSKLESIFTHLLLHGHVT